MNEYIDNLYDLFEESSGVTTDSRNITPGVMFFALRGASFDGNRFAADALMKGASYAVVDSDEPLKEHPELSDRMVRVDDVLEALQALSAEHRRRLAIPIIGIVGSNGKTTTKELVATVLSEHFEVYATRGNLNNHIGVPLTLLSMTAETEFGVVEMGASSCGEIAALCQLSQPNYGVITNIGRSHLEGFGGVEGIRRGKGELFDFLQENGGRAFVPQEDAVLGEMAAEREDMAVESYSRAMAEGVLSNLVGDYNKANIAVAMAVGRYFDIPMERIVEAVASYVPQNNRSQQMLSERENCLILDCYNANPSSMAVAIDNMKNVEAEQKWLILGDMLELGEWSAEEHLVTLRRAAEVEGANMLLVGQEFERAAEVLSAEGVEFNAICFEKTAGAAEFLSQSPITKATVLVKGSRGMTLEKLVGLL